MIYQQVALATSTPVGDPGPLPPELRGRLSAADLADLAWLADRYPALAGTGYWPVEDTSDPLLAYQVAGPAALNPDPERKVVRRHRPAEDLPVEEARAAALAALAAWRYQREVAGTTVVIGGAPLPIRTDRESQALVTGLAVAVTAGVVETAAFRLAAGQIMAADAAAVGTIHAAVVGHVQACRAAEATHAAAIADLETTAAVRGYDFTTGFPGA